MSKTKWSEQLDKKSVDDIKQSLPQFVVEHVEQSAIANQTAKATITTAQYLESDVEMKCDTKKSSKVKFSQENTVHLIDTSARGCPYICLLNTSDAAEHLTPWKSAYPPEIHKNQTD